MWLLACIKQRGSLHAELGVFLLISDLHRRPGLALNLVKVRPAIIQDFAVPIDEIIVEFGIVEPLANAIVI